ncbi:MAG: nucleotidyltransferase domain-containing protein [Enterobacteriaceae bacterium]|nr:nucleotidyltransferase domain-containing protein [Enterobacteriaceae bacterium]
MDLNNLKEQLKNNYAIFNEIKSAYIYGSVLSDRFKKGKSDIDVLFICKDIEKPHPFLKKIKIKTKKIKAKMDINVVFYNEFIKRWHIYRPPTYFIGIKLANELLWGEDLIQNVSLEDVKPVGIYKRIVDLSQGIRGIYINSKNDDFWCEKYKSWLKISLLEILFLHGNFDLNFESGLTAVLKKYPELKLSKALKRKKLSSEKLSEIAELLRIHMFNYFIKK